MSAAQASARIDQGMICLKMVPDVKTGSILESDNVMADVALRSKCEEGSTFYFTHSENHTEINEHTYSRTLISKLIGTALSGTYQDESESNGV